MSSSQDWITSGVTIIILDLIAGLLVSLNLLVRRRWWGQLNKRVSAVLLRLRHNEETQAIFTLSIAALVILVVIGFVVYGLSVDIPRGKFTADELIQQSLLLPIGAFVGMLYMLVFSWGAFRLAMRFTRDNRAFSFNVADITVFGLFIAALWMVRITAMPDTAVFIGASAGIIFLWALLLGVPQLIRLFTLPRLRVAQIGLAIFVVSRVLQLIQYYRG